MKKGFTLVELSIALVIIGLLIGGSVQMMSMLSKRAKVTEAKQQLDTLKERIIGFAQTYSRLPTTNLEELGRSERSVGKTDRLLCR
jgi:prepilin-type N-terminal cleavage/methylation domain-containing protein